MTAKSKVIKGINFIVDKGEFIGIMGVSGAGREFETINKSRSVLVFLYGNS